MNTRAVMQTKKRYSVSLRDIIVFFICIICSGIVYFINERRIYNILTVVPVVFGFCYLFILSPSNGVKYSKTIKLFSICELLRCVLMPIAIVFSDYTGFGVYSTDNQEYITIGILLMCYEVLICSVFLKLFANHTSYDANQNDVRLDENKYALYIVVIIGIVIYLATPAVRRYVNFLSLSANAQKVRALVAGGDSSLFTGLVTIVQFSFLSIFIIILDGCSRQFEKSRKHLPVLVSIIAGLITVSIIFGESRAGIIYTLYAVIKSLEKKYPNYKKRIMVILIIGATTVLIGMTVYRLFAVYDFSSYAAAIENGGYIGKNYFDTFLEGYLLGPQSMAAAVEFRSINSGQFTVERFFYDLFRPFMGFNFLLKGLDIDTTITMYNSWLTGVAGRSNGYFLQITGQCYCYLGFLFSPFFACLSLGISIKIEQWMASTDNLFIYFFLNFVFIRLSTCVLGGTMSGFITTASMTLLITVFFFLMQRAFGSLIKIRTVSSH